MNSIDKPSPDDIRRFKNNPAEFRASLFIRKGDTTAKFTPDEWQAENLAVLDPLWKKVAGVPGGNDVVHKFAWLGRPRGHSKTQDEAMQLMWVLAFSRKHLNGIAAAGSKDQAKFIRDAVERLLLMNPWLGKNGLDLLRVQNYRVFNPKTRSEVDIISSDAPSSFGATPDFVLCDELTHWKGETQEDCKLWDSLFSSAGKVPHCVLIIMTNAGYERTWQAMIRDMAVKGSYHGGNWIYRNLPGPCASWMGQSFLYDQKLGLAPKAYKRLWLNQWQLEAGDALEMKDIEACIRGDRLPMNGDEEGWVFIGGLDLSSKKHRSAFVVLGVHPTEHRVRLGYVRSWKPDEESGQVNLDGIRMAILQLHETYKFVKVLFDPSQAILMGQQLQQQGVWMEEMKFADPKSLTLMATTILDVFKTHRIELYPCDELVSDLTKLNIIERSGFSFKIDAITDSTGHADTAIALAIALPQAVDMAAIPRINPFFDRPVVLTLDEPTLDAHNPPKLPALLGAPVGALSQKRIEDVRDTFVKALEENKLTFGEETDAA